MQILLIKPIRRGTEIRCTLERRGHSRDPLDKKNRKKISNFLKKISLLKNVHMDQK